MNVIVFPLHRVRRPQVTEPVEAPKTRWRDRFFQAMPLIAANMACCLPMPMTADMSEVIGRQYQKAIK
ncbi:hypothetical protein [Phenylobacterium sp.]|uniref:hypothetical protein n=1 Tax=Phenylobacterium sp. TaxID=1871053 RepID=UPI002FCC2593